MKTYLTIFLITLCSLSFGATQEMKDRVKANSHLRKALSIMQNAMMSHSIEFMPNEDVSEALDKAIIECQKCIEIYPKHAEAYATLGAMYWDKDEMDKSIESYTKAIELEPFRDDVISAMGGAYLQMGKIDEAKKQLTLLKELESEFEESLRKEIAEKEKSAEQED
jgi:tetratricopeptide (TPR) repeat protein